MNFINLKNMALISNLVFLSGCVTQLNEYAVSSMGDSDLCIVKQNSNRYTLTSLVMVNTELEKRGIEECTWDALEASKTKREAAELAAQLKLASTDELCAVILASSVIPVPPARIASVKHELESRNPPCNPENARFIASNYIQQKHQDQLTAQAAAQANAQAAAQADANRKYYQQQQQQQFQQSLPGYGLIPGMPGYRQPSTIKCNSYSYGNNTNTTCREP